MASAQWRTNVRALLRLEIYGHGQLGFNYKVVKDLVDEMEYQQPMRHEMLEAQTAHGTQDPTRVGHGFFSDG
jgi:methyl coenzyme M reductase gamma subunit